MKQKRFEKIQRTIEEKFIKNLELLDISSKERFLETFPNLWKRKRRFKEHVNERVQKKHIPKENADLFYAKKIIEVLVFHDKVIVERSHGKFQSSYAVKNNWIVVISEKGKIETAFKLDIPLKSWLETHIFKGVEVKENVYSETIKKATKELWGRIRLF
ncbi:hypothetical protein SAMN06265182_0285 [Persephonella hydrogeniphila]|uniref:Uncharacterized protein n=1 Tax=Persephonella hydrogeniphila TaxID=198703 RepID=A0A285N2Q3_9AQUI|nr:hypothetical protein [Persephonella hydrogeniphila]SNZ03077.1 hypothetical protein SAMN06265182_0285 [Persephonella hydrogeniphila]